MSTTTPTWITLVTASSFGGLITGFCTFLATVLTLRNADRQAKDQWDQEWGREQARWAREDAARSDERMYERLADSYLEVLRIVEREGQWVEANIMYRWSIAADEFMAHDRVMVPAPAVTDRATIGAHLAAFGSDNVRRLYGDWRFTIKEIENEDETLEHIAEDHELSPDDLTHLRDVLRPNQRTAREALADAN